MARSATPGGTRARESFPSGGGGFGFAKVRQRLASLAILAIFVLLVIVLLATTPAFGNWGNIANVLQQNSIIGIVACGMLLMIIVGGFDLSVGAVGAMSSVVAAVLIVNTNPALGILVALAVGAVVGLLNGFCIAVIGMNPFVVTLGTQVLVTGLLFVATEAQPVYGVPESFTQIGLGRIGPLPIATAIFIVVALLVFALLTFTKFGQYIYAVGGNKDAARLAGVNVTLVIIVTYVIGAVLAAVAGIVLLGQTGIGQPNSATGWPLSSIAAVVVGGVPLAGGVGKVSSAVLGTLLLGVVANALNLNGVSPYWQPAVTGIVILLAVGVDSYQRKRRQLR
ncbi:ABC transporter permease [Herbiconiux sp. CPCC 205716]|uniref:ABC transporter permease n=1 Tax=Herbiconiux gentiana TaxID=2970912 RepID=A0ABT2GAI2_9MICO|nr:ABC transporter permease [Herbiconiux gentiana]MCS5713180.1 ABC transporter permease [Herbiconiux gentiana]